MAINKHTMSTKEVWQKALVPEDEQPYKVPDNWSWTRLGIINHYRSTSVDPAKEPDTMFELYSVPSCDNDYPEIVSGLAIGSTKQAVAKNDVLLCKINPRINRVWIVFQHTKHVQIASSEWIVVSNKHLNPRYLMWCLKAKYFREFMLSNVSGVGGSLMRAQPKYVWEYPVPIPPLAEQQRIVDRIESLFNKLDQAKELVQSALDSFENRKAAILHQAFTGELTKKWRVEQKNGHNNIFQEVLFYFTDVGSDKDIKYIQQFQQAVNQIEEIENSEWYRCTIGAIAKVSNGSTPSRKELSFWNGSIPWVSSGEVKNNIISLTNEYISSEGYNNSSVNILKKGTVLIAMIGEGKTRGQVAILDIEATINQNIAAIDIGHNKVNSKFMWYWLQYKYKRNREEGNGTGPKALNCQRVRELEFVLPPLPEQQEIVHILDNILGKEMQAYDLIDLEEKIALMKKTILARAFRGELGTNDPKEESALKLLKEICGAREVK